MITNDALSAWLEDNANLKWERHFGTWETIVWYDDATDIPKESSFEAEKETYLANQRAKHTRVYPPMQDQLDMQYHDAVNGTTTWKDAIAKIKSDNPK